MVFYWFRFPNTASYWFWIYLDVCLTAISYGCNYWFIGLFYNQWFMTLIVPCKFWKGSNTSIWFSLPACLDNEWLLRRVKFFSVLSAVYGDYCRTWNYFWGTSMFRKIYLFCWPSTSSIIFIVALFGADPSEVGLELSYFE